MTGPPRTAIVTGASSGIGAAIALEMGRQGWRVALGARRPARLEEVAKQLESAGGTAQVHVLDVCEPSSIDAFCAAVEAGLGPVDLLVNNAGGSRMARIAEARDEDLERDVALNLLGAMWMTRRLLPGMIERGAGDVVFIGSDTARRPRPYMGAYGAAKAGLEQFARVLEMEAEGTGVRSILVRVGDTASGFGDGIPPERIREMLASWKHWGLFRGYRVMRPEDVARAVVRTVGIPADESHPTFVEVQPSDRRRS